MANNYAIILNISAPQKVLIGQIFSVMKCLTSVDFNRNYLLKTFSQLSLYNKFRGKKSKNVVYIHVCSNLCFSTHFAINQEISL